MPPKSANLDPKCTPRTLNFEPQGPQDLDKISSQPSSKFGGPIGQDLSSKLGGLIGGPAAGGMYISVAAPLWCGQTC